MKYSFLSRFPSTLIIMIVCVLSPVCLSADRPNIVLVVTDQQSATAMSCAQGTSFLNTPHMDSLAANGTRFCRAYSPNPLCMPARGSLFSGRFPHETGIQRNDPQPALPPPFPGMGTYFRQAGYKTCYFGKWHLTYPVKEIEKHGFELVVTKSKAQGGYDTRTTREAVEVLKEKQTTPFLAVVCYLNPHDICQYPRGQKYPCGPIGEMPPLERCPPAPANLLPPRDGTDSVAAIRKGMQVLTQFPVGHYREDDWRRYHWAYDRMVEKVDAELGDLVKALRESGNDRNTVLFFTSDHGDCGGAHGFNQKTVFYEESAGVPLIVSKLDGSGAEKRCRRLVNIGVDLLPTMLDYAGLPIPEELPGKSIRPLAEHPDASWDRDFLVLQNHMNQTGEVDGIRPSIEGRAVVTQRFKYAVYSQGLRRESLFDLETDPGETCNLAYDRDFRDVLHRQRNRLSEFARRYSDSLALELLAGDVPPIPITNSPLSFTPKK